jgi:hypothetical protein
MVAKFWEGLPVSEKKKKHKFGMVRFNLKKPDEMEVMEQ